MQSWRFSCLPADSDVSDLWPPLQWSVGWLSGMCAQASSQGPFVLDLRSIWAACIPVNRSYSTSQQRIVLVQKTTVWMNGYCDAKLCIYFIGTNVQFAVVTWSFAEKRKKKFSHINTQVVWSHEGVKLNIVARWLCNASSGFVGPVLWEVVVLWQ